MITFWFDLNIFQLSLTPICDLFTNEQFIFLFLLLLEVIARQVARTTLAFRVMRTRTGMNAVSCFAKGSAFVIAVWTESSRVDLARRVTLATSLWRVDLHLRPSCQILVRLNQLFYCCLTWLARFLTIEKWITPTWSDSRCNLRRSSFVRHRLRWWITNIDGFDWKSRFGFVLELDGLHLGWSALFGWRLCGFVCGQREFAILLGAMDEILSWNSERINSELRYSPIEQLIRAVQCALN